MKKNKSAFRPVGHRCHCLCRRMADAVWSGGCACSGYPSRCFCCCGHASQFYAQQEPDRTAPYED